MMKKINLFSEKNYNFQKEVMQLNKKQVAITLGAMCLILSAGICIQIRTMDNASTTASRNLSDNELRDNVLKWKEKYDNISQELKKAEKTLEKVRQSATQNDSTASAKEEELKKNNTLLGLTNVVGQGIVIEIADGDNPILAIDNPSDLLVHNDDLMSLVNELNNAGAEAIEINGQRIVNNSSITCEGNIIKVNGEKIGSPFTIKAIGSQALLYGSITRSGSYLDLMKNRGVNVKSVSQKDKAHISKYNGTISYNYIQTAKQK